MNVQLIKTTISNKYFTFNAMIFLPPMQRNHSPAWALLTHGYTSSKTDCVSWAQRLSEASIACCIFDLPGHHLGSYNKLNSFEEFKLHSHECFSDAYELLQSHVKEPCEQLILAGHSLGALLAIKALSLNTFSLLPKLAIGVGVGIGQHKTAHLFETSFYEKTLNIRRQLVDEHIDSQFVFPWIKEEKENINITNQRVHLITGLDDVVVGEKGAEVFRQKLEKSGNSLSLSEPKKLPHHEPSMATSHIYNFLKKELSFSNQR